MPMGHQSHKKNLMSLMQILLLLVLLLSIHHVDSGTIVKFLPGFEGPLPFELETGYIGIGEKEEIQLFYYFIKSENNPQEDPLLIWMSGGPGCSSICGLLYEIGPVAIKTEAYHVNIPSLVSTTHSWTKMANIVFLDQPVGTGFSYKRTPITEKTSDTKEIVRVHEFLQKWLDRHPEFYSNPFYVGGDSYSGKIVPGLVQRISTENYICCKPPINLQGYVLGNPVTDIEEEINYQIPFTHGMGLISNELYESMKRICKGYYVNEDSQNPECLQLIETFEKCTEKINKLDILLPNCDVTSPDCFSYKDTLLSYWTNDERVREALQIRKGSVGEWKRCESILYDKDIKSAVAYHMNNSINGYRSLIYNGDHDMLVSFLATEAWIKSLNYSIIDDWRPWMNKDNILGYTRTYANKMTYATIKGGGHTAEYKPEESFMMFQRWITGQLL